MRFVIVAEGRLKERAFRELADLYLGRLRRYLAVEEREVASKEKLSAQVVEGALVVALEVEGQALSTVELLGKVEAWIRSNKGVVVFLIGGAEGLPEELSRQAHFRLSLSKLTLPHRLARVVLLEQLYRVMSLKAGEPYAREG